RAPPRRPGVGGRAAPVGRALWKGAPDPDLRARFARALAEPYPPGARNTRLSEAFASGDDPALERLKVYAEEIGLDGAEVAARIEAGGTTNYGLAQDWVERDMAAVLAKDGTDRGGATDDQQAAALDKVDRFMDGLRERARELGVPVALAEDGDELQLIDEEDRGPNTYLQDLADMLRDGNLSAAQEESIERTLRAELYRELGEEGIAELRSGNYEVLVELLPNRIDQIAVTQEFLELTHEETGDQVFTDRASALQQDKVEALARDTHLELHRGRDLSRDLDDEIGF
ncbi:MAG: endonuclease, partial [Tateyamaria sp.]